jgi:hypothetical protein
MCEFLLESGVCNAEKSVKAAAGRGHMATVEAILKRVCPADWSPGDPPAMDLNSALAAAAQVQ